MMPVNFQRLRRGAWKVTEPTARAIIEVAEWWNQHKLDGGTVQPPEYFFQGDIVEVRNDSGSAQNRFSVLGLEAALITNSQNLTEFQNYPRFSVVTPLAPNHVGTFCILVEPLAAGAIGKALVSGVCPVMLQPLSSAADQFMYADILSGQTGYLVERNWGAAQVLWYDTGGTGTRWALVRIDQPETIGVAQLTANLYACQSAAANILGFNPDTSQFLGGAIVVTDLAGMVNGSLLATGAPGLAYIPSGCTVAWKYFNDSGLFVPLGFGEFCAGSSGSSGSGSSGSSGSGSSGSSGSGSSGSSGSSACACTKLIFGEAPCGLCVNSAGQIMGYWDSSGTWHATTPANCPDPGL